jgi:hypothetical protein
MESRYTRICSLIKKVIAGSPFIYAFIFIACLLQFHQLHAQDKLAAKLNTQLAAYNVSFEDMMEQRGWTAYRSGPVNFEMVRAALEDYNYFSWANHKAASGEAAMLFYEFASDTLYTWLLSYKGIDSYTAHKISAAEIESYKTGLEQNFAGSVGTVVPAGNDRGIKVNKSADQDFDLAYYNTKLCDVLFPAEMMQAISKNRIMFLQVIPAAGIATVPLYCLKPYPNDAYVIDSLCISIGYSVGHFIETTHKLLKMFDGVYTAGGLVFNPGKPLLAGNPQTGKRCDAAYPPLPGAEAEVNEIAALLKSEALTGSAATKDAVLKRLDGADFIYLATHGYADPSDPLRSYVLLSSGNQDSCAHWTADEIQHDTLSEDLVVLSACQTGLGKAHTAGIIGIARAFIIAGAWNVVMSLWSVEDQPTKEMMVSFVKELFVKHDYFPAGNLRQAILDYKKKDPNPAHWSAFISMGYVYPAGSVMNIKLEK